MSLRRRNSVEILLLLLFTDFFIIALNLAASLYAAKSGESFWYWSVGADRGFGETFQYVKELWLVLSFAALIKLRSDWSYLSLCFLFCYLLIDDLVSIHEAVGTAIGTRLNLQFVPGLRPGDVGEVLFSTIAGIFFLLVIGCAYWFGGKTFRHVCKRVLVLLFGLAFCGIVLDAIHILVGNVAWLSLSLEILEDGGEMLIMSVLCWYGISLLNPRDRSSTEVPNLLHPQPESSLQR